MKKKQDHFLKLYEPIHDRFERFCRARVFGNMEHKDLMNETLLIAFQKIETLKSEGAFLSFLIGISVRILANNHRKKKEEYLPQQADFDFVDVNANTEKSAELYLLYKALALLPEVQRECIILFEISGFSIKEFMKIQSASESAIKQRLKRARARLTQILTFNSEKRVEVKDGTR
ncbi:MAG: RNA polymerase sigma factor [Flavobacteriales bacterium]|nr:RNA polymerase sigma factor [Flavobacteriales bacterium]